MTSTGALFTFFTFTFFISKAALKELTDSISVWENYSTMLAPNGPIEVSASIEPFFLMDLSVQDLQFELEFSFLMMWKDERVINENGRNDPVDIEGNDRSRVWRPRIQFSNCKKCDRLLQLESSELQYHFGARKFLTRGRKIVTFSCNYQYSNYPFDTQECPVELEVDEVNKTVSIEGQLPTQELNLITTPEYTIVRFFIEKQEPGQRFVQFKFHICRLTGQYILLIYIPSALIVVLTWFPFWVEIENLNPKVSVSVTALLALVTQLGVAQSKLPGVSYVKAIDIWMLTCIVMVLASLTATAAGNFMFWLKKQAAIKEPSTLSLDKLQLTDKTPLRKKPPTNTGGIWRQFQSPRRCRGFCRCCGSIFRKLTRSSSKLDSVCRFLFPVVFFTFLIFYFSTYYRTCDDKMKLG